ncbi:galactose mutarotase [Cellulophaga baltica]|uniref:aldose epimerase family protein n=1 Tax=Cellulophaga TaxID=104264 RepID=UPI001C078E60|nr:MULTISPECIES: aldose epimerase family protein [Cellulophaga]MBU2996569.1 galactose mutarotase [Cellulophaga baltica]MDO6767963.1 aldose epimerase family protein [Cellulophaga sp. 1_MG-2023]
MNQITIKNDSITLTVIDYGAIIQKIIVKDKNGIPNNMVIGHDKPEDYLNDDMYLSACIGRYAGRIADGKFSLNGTDYTLFEDNGIHLHGGKKGFNQKYFTIEEVKESEEPFIKLSYLSPHLEEGYPGNLKVMVTYALIGNSLKITHEATTDKTTVLNLTNHAYFKLDNQPTVSNYNLELGCSRKLETNDKLLPSGNFVNIAGTSYDFRTKKKINDIKLDTPFEIDHNRTKAASVNSEVTGITMEVTTNQPALIVYTPPVTGSICFETQNFPDAPNQNNFPSSKLEPGEKYFNESFFTFSV